jgi:hypothetical protein
VIPLGESPGHRANKTGHQQDRDAGSISSASRIIYPLLRLRSSVVD